MRLATKAPPAKRYAKEITPKAKPDSFVPGEISTVEGLWWGRISRYNPDDLVGKKGLQIYEKMLRDEQVKAALHAKMMAVISSGHEVLPPEVPEGDKEMADETADFVRFNFEEMDGALNDKLLEMMSAMTFGFSCAEKVYGLIAYGKYDGKVGLKALKFRKPWSIDFETDTHGNLLPDGILQGEKRLPTNKFVLCTYWKMWGNPYGDSDLRAAYKGWWSKDVIFKYMTIALERFGEPIADISHTGTITPTQRADLNAFMRNLQSRSGLIHPDLIKLLFHNPSPRTGEAFQIALKICDSYISRAILMPALLGMSGEEQVGSLARSGTEFDVFLWVVAYLRGWIETVINEQIIKLSLIDPNYEITGGMYPTFKFKAITEETKYKLFQTYLQGIASEVLTKTRDDEIKFREMLDLPPLPEQAPGTIPEMEQEGAGDQTGQFPPSDQGGFLFQDKDGHLYERSFDDEAKLVEFVRGLRRAA